MSDPVSAVEVARAESARGEVVLRRREDDGLEVLELRVNGVFVMDTLETSTERALARLTLGLVEHPSRVLVGGLGLGFTAHEVLGDSRVADLRVVEIEPAIAGWMRDGTVPHGPAYLADARVTLTEGDVAVVVAEAPDDSYDLVLLDVDNGPGYLVHQQNAEVYRSPFLTDCRRALAPGGVLAVWSADEAPDLEAALRTTYDAVERHGLPVDLQGRDERYWLYAARKADAG